MYVIVTDLIRINRTKHTRYKIRKAVRSLLDDINPTSMSREVSPMLSDYRIN